MHLPNAFGEIAFSCQAQHGTVNQAHLDLGCLCKRYSYHALFAEALRSRLEQMGGENVCALHLRASCWYEQQGNITEAVEHAFNAGAWERAADLLESKPRTHPLGTPEGQMIARWVEKLPAEVVHSWPQLGQLTTRDLMKPGKSSVDELWSQTAKAGGFSAPSIERRWLACTHQLETNGSDSAKRSCCLIP